MAELLAEKPKRRIRTDVPDRMSIPEELARRQDRLEKLAVAKAKIEAARRRNRYARGVEAEHEAKLAAREAKTAATRAKNPAANHPSRRCKARCRRIRSI